jgi:hypothetical protein
VSRVDDLAEDIVNRVLSEQGVTKAAGTVNRAALLPVAYAVASGIELVYEQVEAYSRDLRAYTKALKKSTRKMAERTGMLAGQVPGVTEVGRRHVDLDLERFGIQLAGRNLSDSPDPFYRGHSVNPENDPN